jgi:hypothetical protein
VTRQNVLEYSPKAPSPLTAKDIFGVVVKTIGFCISVYGCYTILYGVAGAAWGLFPTVHGIGTYVIFGAIYLGFGIGLMRTQWVADFAYGRD